VYSYLLFAWASLSLLELISNVIGKPKEGDSLYGYCLLLKRMWVGLVLRVWDGGKAKIHQL